MPVTVPEATPSRMTTQSKGAELCRLVSQPSGEDVSECDLSLPVREDLEWAFRV